ncbi:MAG: polyprenol monophosphomannose synthase [Nanoarchaeota archaeon]|nr:polyprenol monophosphomannose synthase [Nanoarchaeota archaeon]
MTKCAVILPTYNERENIESLIKDIFDVSSKNGLHISIIVVDDNSPDGTGDLVSKLAQKKHKNKLYLIARERKLGLGTAHIAGFKFALDKGYDYIITMDADFSHSPKYLPEMINKMGSCDICIGSRYVYGGGTKNCSYGRKILSKGAKYLIHKMTGLKARDCTNAFRCYKQVVLKKIEINNIHSNGYSFLIEMLFLCQSQGFKIREIPIIFENRKLGASKISRKEIIKGIKSLLRLALKRIF